MPESLYFFSFWLLTYLVLSINKELSVSRWVFSGVIFGCISLIKPHALFLVPALVVFLFMIQRQSDADKPNKFYYIKYCGFFLAAISTKLIIGYALAGKSGITILGSIYSTTASASMGAGHYFKIIKLAFENFQGHILSLCLLFSVPVGQVLLASRLFFRRDSESRSSINVALYTSLVLLTLLAVVALFTASVSGSAPSETNSRLHMRYYDFALPLLLLVAASQLSLSEITASVKYRAIIGLPIGAAICYATYTHLAAYDLNSVDSPELRGFTFNSSVFEMLSLVSAFSLALWVYAARSGAKVFLYIFMPLVVCFSTFYVNQELRQRLVLDVFDRAGIFTKQYLSNEDISKTVIVGSDIGPLYRSSLFYLDNPKTSVEIISKGAAYDLSTLPLGKEWILVVGDHELRGNTVFQLSMGGFTLAKVPGPKVIDFKKGLWPGVISSVRGLSFAEPWGTWSTSDVVIFEFSEPLPEKFNVQLTAHAFGPNVGKEFEARVGDSTSKFILGAANEEKVIAFDNVAKSNTLMIKVPIPISPNELSNGSSNDQRSLGIGLIEMKITPF
jgi:phosphoglycerol transferase